MASKLTRGEAISKHVTVRPATWRGDPGVSSLSSEDTLLTHYLLQRSDLVSSPSTGTAHRIPLTQRGLSSQHSLCTFK
eukprot:4328191-Amphidinium_carterae.1